MMLQVGKKYKLRNYPRYRYAEVVFEDFMGSHRGSSAANFLVVFMNDKYDAVEADTGWYPETGEYGDDDLDLVEEYVEPKPKEASDFKEPAPGIYELKTDLYFGDRIIKQNGQFSIQRANGEIVPAEINSEEKPKYPTGFTFHDKNNFIVEIIGYARSRLPRDTAKYMYNWKAVGESGWASEKEIDDIISDGKPISFENCNHCWVDTGTRLSFCKHCNADKPRE